MASVKANPKIAILNNSSFNEGFLEIPRTKAPNNVYLNRSWTPELYVIVTHHTAQPKAT
jgi:hypothetical protein